MVASVRSMLRHFAIGPVRWKQKMPCHTRTNWEFYAVLKGRAGLRFDDAQPWGPQPLSLWVFAPDCSHGWANFGGAEFTRLVLHFSTIPEQLADLVRKQCGWLQRPLSVDEAAQLHAMGEALRPHFHQPTRLSHLHVQRHLMTLTLMLLEQTVTEPAGPALTDLAALKIEQAIEWYGGHLSERPTVEQVADAVHVSPSHLRRLFLRVHQISPKEAFQRVRVERAHELMAGTVLTLEAIAAATGYASASHLCREHRSLCEFTPSRWRRSLVDQFDDSDAPQIVKATDCAVRPRSRG